jgi:HPr kinase/phosphorylase
VPVVFVCKSLEAPPALLEVARETETPVVRSRLSTIDVIHELTHLLEDALAPTTTVHGSLVDVYGVGLLLTQIAKRRGAMVITTVGSASKV